MPARRRSLFAGLACAGLFATGIGGNAYAATGVQSISDSAEVWSGIFEGRLDWGHEPRLIQATDRVPGRLGLSFGIYFTVETQPQDATGLLFLQNKTSVPDPGFHDPRTGQMVHEVTGITECRIGHACLAGYTFDTLAEIVPGEWRTTVSYRGKELLSRTYLVEAAPAAE